VADRSLPPFAAEALKAWWHHDAETLLDALGGARCGLTDAEAERRLATIGPNALADRREPALWPVVARQLGNPLTLILAAGAIVSLVVGEWIDAATILLILAIGAGIGSAQELHADRAMAALRRRLAIEVSVRRPTGLHRQPADRLVPGDVVELSAGSLIPCDGVIVESRDFLVDQSALTGESLPVEKRAGTAAADAALAERTNAVLLGGSVRSGTATVLVVATGRFTAMAEVASRLGVRDELTQFERGMRRFGELLLRVMFGVVVCVLVVNQIQGRPALDSALFAIALAVGLSPELLPAILAVSLARGAQRLAQGGVLVRRLDAIEDLGTIDTLCTDKTGTLTVGEMALEAAVDSRGDRSSDVLRWAWLNAHFETGIENPIDAAMVRAGRDAGLDASGWTKVDEIPYDFVRRRLTVVLAATGDPARHHLISKGAFAQIVDACDRVRDGSAEAALDAGWRARLEAFVVAQGERGVRVLALARAERPARTSYGGADEDRLTFIGFLCFADPPKPDARAAIRALADRGVRVKMITGDNRHVAGHVAREVGLDPQAMLTGEAIARMRDEALWSAADRTDLFVEVDPSQKERIVRALQRTGHAVGYLGDGINDAPALHAADVGISVHTAVDVARESADIVLLGPDLDMLRRGLEEGRRTFATTLKYIYITISANFGNMVSMALATPVLAFQPLTATQILLNNLLSDLPSMALTSDRVDARDVERVPRWDLAEVRRFMISFGLLSSLFDVLAFALLRIAFHTNAEEFHTAWFVLSLFTELVALILLRTHRPVWRSAPGSLLVVLTGGVALSGVLLTVLPWSGVVFGFVQLPALLWVVLLGLLIAYAAATELAKRRFFAVARR
jgi:Mg2+-importing ATPase